MTVLEIFFLTHNNLFLIRLFTSNTLLKFHFALFYGTISCLPVINSYCCKQFFNKISLELVILTLFWKILLCKFVSKT